MTSPLSVLRFFPTILVLVALVVRAPTTAATATCGKTASGAHKTPNPRGTSWSDPFGTGTSSGQAGSFSAAMARLQSVFLGQIRGLFLRAESLVTFALLFYAAAVVSITILFWIDACIRYHKNVLRAVLQGYSNNNNNNNTTTASNTGTKGQPVLVLGWAVLTLVFAVVLAPVVAILWPIWVPSICIALALWCLRRIFQFLWSQLPLAWSLLCFMLRFPYQSLCYLYARYSGGRQTASPHDTERRNSRRQNLANLENNLIEVHRQCDDRYPPRTPGPPSKQSKE